jgi:SOS response regulatory protein OraA/RecX
MPLNKDASGKITSCGCEDSCDDANADPNKCSSYVCFGENGAVDKSLKCVHVADTHTPCTCQGIDCYHATVHNANACYDLPCNNFCVGNQTFTNTGCKDNKTAANKCYCSGAQSCVKGSCGASCGSPEDCANMPGSGGFACGGDKNQTINHVFGACDTNNCACYLKPLAEITKTCGNTGENDACGSPSNANDCNACDVQGDQSGNQGKWADANADKCDPACNSYFDSLNQAHIAASSPAANASTFQLKPELACDAIDNDCNGIIDDVNGGASINDTKCKCYNGAIKPGEWREVCNGIDDNCNSQVDEGGVCNTTDNCGTYGNNCKIVLNATIVTCVNGQCIIPCTVNLTKSCYTGAANTLGVGACKNGTQTCKSDGTWGSCDGQIVPITEICIDKIDNNCNNLTDDPLEGCGQHNQSLPVTSSVCGNGKCDANETQDTCPADCGCPPNQELVGTTCKEKTEQPAVCGNDVAEFGEECDGTDDSSCMGLCTPDCACIYLVGDGKCDKAAGESAITSPVDCKTTNFGLIAAIIAIIGGVVGGLAYYIYKRKSNLNTLAQAHGVDEPVTGGDLEPAVNTMLSQGYSPAEVSQNLTNSGWSSDDIQGALASAHQDQSQLGDLAEKYGVDVPSDEIKDAEDYTKKCLDTGFTPAQIRTALMSAEWPASTVDDVLSKFTQAHVEGDAKKAGVLEPTDDVDKLKDFVKKVLDEGQTPQQIKKSLLDSGWQESALKEVLP